MNLRDFLRWWLRLLRPTTATVPGGDPSRWLCVMTAEDMATLHDNCGPAREAAS